MMRKRRYTVAKDSFFSVFSVARKRLNTARPLAATKHVGPNGVRHWGERRSPLRSTEKSSRRAKKIGISNTEVTEAHRVLCVEALKGQRTLRSTSWSRLCRVVLLLILLPAATAKPQWNPLNPVKSVEKQSDGVLFRMQTGLLRLQACSDSIVRVLYTPTPSFPDVKQYAV